MKELKKANQLKITVFFQWIIKIVPFFDECSEEKNRIAAGGCPGAKPRKILTTQHSAVVKTSFLWLSVRINSDKLCFTLNK